MFWGLALLASMLETVEQVSMVAGHRDVTLFVGAAMFGLGVFEAYLFRRYGFLAPLVCRLTFYFVWHVVGSMFGL